MRGVERVLSCSDVACYKETHALSGDIGSRGSAATSSHLWCGGPASIRICGGIATALKLSWLVSFFIRSWNLHLEDGRVLVTILVGFSGILCIITLHIPPHLDIFTKRNNWNKIFKVIPTFASRITYLIGDFNFKEFVEFESEEDRSRLGRP